MFDHSGKVTYYVQSGAFYRTMGRVDITYNNTLEKLDYDYINIDENVQEDADMKHFIDSLEEDANNSFQMNCFSQQVTFAEDNFWELNGNLLTEGYKDTPVGNLVTDAFIAAVPEADIAIEPCGSTAQPLYYGPLVGNDIFRMIGYGFNDVDVQYYKLVTFDLLGIQLLGGLQIALKDIGLDDELFVQCSGLEYAYYTNHDSTDRLIMDSVKVDGQPINPGATYKIVTNEFVANLFAGMLGQDLPNKEVIDTLSEFSVVLQYVMQNPVIIPVSEGRIKAMVDPNIGVNEYSSGESVLRIYPNPAKGNALININVTEPGNYSIKLFNSMGQEITRIQPEFYSSGKQTKSINLSFYAPGLYYLRLTNGNVTKSINMIVE